MLVRSLQDIPVFVNAFDIAWRWLLHQERVTAENIEELPIRLMRAILLTSLRARTNSQTLAEVALLELETDEQLPGATKTDRVSMQ